ncbi:hypothetical protein OAQ99_06970 [Candidatus Kapabacteria bacterium]|nr:hypothetical protein [Candidatus Kapabacteria bacterium]
MKITLIISIFFSISLFNQELSEKEINTLPLNNTLEDYYLFLDMWNGIPKEITNWEEDRITSDTPLSLDNAEGRINRILIHPTIPGLYFVGTSSNGLWISKNFGSDWNNVKIDEFTFGISKLELSGIDLNSLMLISGDQKIKDISKSQFSGLYLSNDLGNSFSRIDISNLKYIPSDVTPFGNDFIISTKNEIFRYNIELGSFLQINYEFQSNFNIYKIINYDNEYLGICSRDSIFNSSKYQIARIVDDSLKIIYELKNPDPNVLFVPELSFDLNSKTYETKLLQIKDNVSSKLVTITMDSEENISIDNIELEDDFIQWQGDYNNAIKVSPTDSKIIYAGGVNINLSTDNGLTWKKNSKNVHVDLHDIAYDEFTGEVFAATDGGLYSQNLLDTIWRYRSEGVTAGQFFWGDVSRFNPNEFVGGKMDNGSFYKDYNSILAVGGGDGMQCFFSEKNPTSLYNSLQNSRISKFDSQNNLITTLDWDTLKTTRRPWMTKFNISNDSIWLYQDDIWMYNNNEKSWQNLTNLSDSITFAEKIEEYVYFQTNKGEIYQFKNKSKKLIFNLNNLELQIKDFYLEQNLLIGISSDEKNIISIFDLENNSLLNQIELLEGTKINCIEKFNNNYLLGTDDGVFSINDKFEINSLINLYDDNYPIRGVRRLIVKPKFGYVYAFTFGQDLRKLKINDCSGKLIQTNISGTIFKCPEISLLYNVDKIEKGINYKLSSMQSISSTFIDKQGKFYFTGENEDCLIVSEKLIVKNYEVPHLSTKSQSLNNIICDNNPITLSIISDSSLISKNLIWNTGEIGSEIEVFTAGSYWASYLSSNGCLVYSDTINVYSSSESNFVRPNIILLNGKLQTENGKKVNWFLNDSLIKLSSNLINKPAFGSYKAIYLNDTCSLWSNEYIFKDTGQIKISPNLVFESINVDILIDLQNPFEIVITDQNGKQIFNRTFYSKGYNHISIDASKFALGQYYLSLKSKSIYKNLKFIKEK